MAEEEKAKSGNGKNKKESSPKKIETWSDFIRNPDVKNRDIKLRLRTEIGELYKKHKDFSSEYKILFLYDSHTSITTFESDRIYTSLLKVNPNKEKNILLILLSNGGRIEPAYQISKICCNFSKDKFIVTIPRAAKSSATLISLGANEIHMGLLSELGPIDPQINGIPVLGLADSLEQVAKICEKHPKSSELFSDYLSKSLRVVDIGYYQRIGESAAQYAERLIANKPDLKDKAEEIARKLVHDYKDHGFVIDAEEAKIILGKNLIKTNTSEIKIVEAIHQIIDDADFWLRIYRKGSLSIAGDLDTGIFIQSK